MKTIILPSETSNDQIELINLSPDVNGIIIAYRDNIPVGYITEYDYCWDLHNTLSTQNVLSQGEESLQKLIQKCIDNKIANNFKYLEFEESDKSFIESILL